MIDRDGTIRLSLPPSFQQRSTFHEWLQQAYADRFTGAVVVHFGQGVAHEIEIPGEPQRIRLDKRG